MPRGAQVTAKTHPQRERIDNALISGVKPTALAKLDWLNPKLSHVALCNYWNKEVKPRLNSNATVIKALADNGLLAETANVERVGAAIKKLTGESLLADPLLARIAKHQQTVDNSILEAQADKDGRTIASLIGTDLKGLELHARLTGRLDSNAGNSGVSITINCPVENQPKIQVSDDGSATIDIG